MRAFYHEVKKKTNPPADPTYVIWNPDSSKISPSFSSTKVEYLEYWAKYLEKTFQNNSISSFNERPREQSSSKEDQLTESEVVRAIKELKNLKAAGIDEITNEDIKMVENLSPGLILNVLQCIWIQEDCPESFRKSIICLFPKPQKPGNKYDHRF